MEITMFDAFKFCKKIEFLSQIECAEKKKDCMNDLAAHMVEQVNDYLPQSEKKLKVKRKRRAFLTLQHA